ncbi:ADP compounds hydrolase NudE [Alkalilimnicola ehrlichii MLHE-1]|nr:ADP compounds hydrolase NudE [Alkalilimnicola ehrlichii]
MSKYPEILHRRTVARSRLFRVEAVGLRFSNGAEVEYERLGGTSHGAVLIVAVDGQGRAQLIREYAAGTGRYELGLPKGRVEKDEPLLDAANRELQEEVGVAARRLEWLRSLSLAPGYLAHRTEVILAQDLYPSRLPGDEPEPIQVVPWALDDLEGLLAQEDFSEARSLAALYLARDHLRAREAR